MIEHEYTDKLSNEFNIAVIAIEPKYLSQWYNEEIAPVLHICFYPTQPQEVDLDALREELKTDPEFKIECDFELIVCGEKTSANLKETFS